MNFQLLVDGDERKMWRSICECIIEKQGSVFNITLVWEGFKIAIATEFSMEAAADTAKRLMESLQLKKGE